MPVDCILRLAPALEYFELDYGELTYWPDDALPYDALGYGPGDVQVVLEMLREQRGGRMCPQAASFGLSGILGVDSVVVEEDVTADCIVATCAETIRN